MAAELIYTLVVVALAVAGLVWVLRTVARFRLVLYAIMALLLLLWLTGELAGRA